MRPVVRPEAFERLERAADHRRHARREYEVLSEALVQRIRAGSVPPDDACAWTRILVRASRVLTLTE